jgi:hypothetical protein
MKQHARRIVVFISLLVAFSTFGMAQTPPNSDISPIKIKRDVNRILQNPDYQWKSRNTPILNKIGNMFIHAFHKLVSFLKRLFPQPKLHSTSVNPIMAKILMVVLTLILVALLAWLIAVLIKGGSVQRKSEVKKRTKLQNSKLEEEPKTLDHPEDLLSYSKALFDKGEWRRSYRYAFLAMLLLLDRKGFIQYEKSRTNGDYLRALRSKKQLYPLFRKVCLDFDIKWYGHAPIDSVSCQRFMKHYEDMQGMIGDEAAMD